MSIKANRAAKFAIKFVKLELIETPVDNLGGLNKSGSNRNGFN